MYEQVILLLHHGLPLFRSAMLALDFGVVLLGVAEALSAWQASALLVLRAPRLILLLASFRFVVG